MGMERRSRPGREDGPTRGLRKGLLCAAIASLAAVAAGPISVAAAEPPNITIASPSGGTVTNDQTPSFSGTTDDPLDEVELNIYPGTSVGTPLETLATSFPPVDGTWSLEPTAPLSDGVYTAQATQTNILTETGRSEPPVTFTVDTASPTVTLDQPPSPSNDTKPSFTGSASDTTPVTVQIYAGATAEGSVVSTATAAGTGGGWASGDADPALSSGQYTAVATQESSLGNPAGSSEARTFTVDTSSPTVTLDQPKSPSNDTTPSFTGTASDTTSVVIHIYAGAAAGGSVVSAATATGTGGGWTSGHASPALSSGQYTAVATQASSLGNPAGVSEPVTFTVDTTSPTVTLDPVKSPSNDTTPSFTGFASDATPVTVQIYAGATAEGSVASTATATGTGGDWTSVHASPALSSGQYTAIATQESSLGNPSGVSEPVTFTVDTASPQVTLDQPKSPSNDTTPSFTGTASDTTSVVVHIYAGAAAEGSVVAAATATGTGGGWTSGHASPALSSGQYTAVATQESSLGNPAGVSEPVTFTVDTTSPTVTLDPVKSPSNDTTPSFTGSASATTAVTVQIYAGARAEGTVVSTATAAGNGGEWTSGHASPPLRDGQYTAIATQPSPLGNPAGVSEPVTFTVNTAAPTVTLDSPALRSNNTTPAFSGTASDTTPVTVRIYAGATATGAVVSSATAPGTSGAWVSGNASPALSSGQYTAVATQESSLGNPSGVSQPRTFIVDTTSPTVTLSQPKSPSNNTAPSFSGSASDTTSVTVQIYSGSTAKGTVISTATATPEGGGWTSSKASPALSSGQYTAVATQPSSLGNPAGTSSPVTFVVDTSSPAVTLNPVKSPSNNTTPSFTGSASDITSVTIQVYAGAAAKGALVATATATGTGGAWTSGNASPPLSSGQYTAVATQESSLGNPPGRSKAVTFIVDTTSPTVTLNAPKSPSNDTAPTFKGSASDTTPVIVRIYDASNSEVSSATATPSGGTWTSGKASPSLSGGKHTYTAIATQASSLGNPSGTSRPVDFTVDTNPPTVTLNPPIARSNDATPSFSGSASDTTVVTVRIYAGGKAAGSVVATATATPAGGSWISGNAHPALANGKHTYTAVAMQESSIGNPTGSSEARTFTVDTAAPTVTLNVPPSRSNDPTPSFTGTSDEASEVVVHIYDDSNSEVAKATAPGIDGSWTSSEASPALADGSYRAVATQESLFGNAIGETASFSFTIDTVPPRVTLSYPADRSSTSSGSQLVRGSASTAEHDLSGVIVQLYSGSAVTDGQAPLQSIAVSAASGAWSATFAGLGAGTYALRAKQSDDAGNVGVSPTIAFTVVPAAPAHTPSPPTAAFYWFPSAPQTGESVSLVSSSTSAGGPITAFAWDLKGGGAFAAGGPVISTSFSTPGRHLVRLRVSDASGLSSVVARTIEVSPAPLPLMRPFPIVRIVTTHTASRLKLSLLSVQASAGAQIVVRCKGRGCPVKTQTRVAVSGKVRGAAITFRRFERSLRVGVVLEIRVSKPGEIGKYTRFTIRRGRRPVRFDACLAPAGTTPITCPSS